MDEKSNRIIAKIIKSLERKNSMKWEVILNVVIFLLEKVMEDSDGDGRPDMFEYNKDTEVK